VPNVQETNLAWAVVEAAKPYLSARDRNHVFVAVGAGDTFRTIRLLLKLASTKQIPLPAELVQRCTTWLDTYGLSVRRRSFCAAASKLVRSPMLRRTRQMLSPKACRQHRKVLKRCNSTISPRMRWPSAERSSAGMRAVRLNRRFNRPTSALSVDIQQVMNSAASEQPRHAYGTMEFVAEQRHAIYTVRQTSDYA
jgi:hypothetical protein